MSENAIAIHACGFENENRICQITRNRLQEAHVQARTKKIENFIISGGVPYKKGGELLAYLIGKWFENKHHVHYAIDCFDSSTDIQNILRIAQEKQFTNILAISSYWHLWALKPLYKYWARELDYRGGINTVVSNTARDHYLTSRKTILSYFLYACLIRLAMGVHLFKPLDKFLSSVFSKRKNGYPVSGCS